VLDSSMGFSLTKNGQGVGSIRYRKMQNPSVAVRDGSGTYPLPSMHRKHIIDTAHHAQCSMALWSTIMEEIENLKYLLMGGAGMWMILSFTGHDAGYWNVIAGAWGYGLLCAWVVIPQAFDIKWS
jgi:hypothetical protein